MIKIILSTEYNPSEVLQLNEVENPVPIDNEVLTKISEAKIII